MSILYIYIYLHRGKLKGQFFFSVFAPKLQNVFAFVVCFTFCFDYFVIFVWSFKRLVGWTWHYSHLLKKSLQGNPVCLNLYVNMLHTFITTKKVTIFVSIYIKNKYYSNRQLIMDHLTVTVVILSRLVFSYFSSRSLSIKPPIKTE